MHCGMCQSKNNKYEKTKTLTGFCRQETKNCESHSIPNEAFMLEDMWQGYFLSVDFFPMLIFLEEGKKERHLMEENNS